MARRLADNLRNPNAAAKLSSADPRSFGTLMPVTQALALLTASVSPVTAHKLGISDAVGFVLAEPIMAPTALPPEPVALRDGYAVTASNTVGAAPYTPVLLNTHPPVIAAGNPLPGNTDAVLPLDALSVEGGFVQVTQAIVSGENVRRAGEDARRGCILRAAGERVRPIDVAAAVTAGIGECSIRRLEVRVLFVSQYDKAAGTLVAAFLTKAGASVSASLSVAGQASLARALGEPGADLDIVIGGTDFGRPGDSSCAVAEVGTVIAHGLALRPGEAGGCGLVDRKPVLLVPARLEAALAMMLMVAQPCLDFMLAAAPACAMQRGILTRKLVSTIGLSEIVLLRHIDGGLEPLATADLTLSAIVSADAWLGMPPGSEGAAAGMMIEAFAL